MSPEPDFLYCPDCRVLEEIENAKLAAMVMGLHRTDHLVEEISFIGHPDLAEFMVKSGARLGKLEITEAEMVPA